MRRLLAWLAAAVAEHHHIATGWLICVLALAAIDPFWTLWQIADDGAVVGLKSGLEREKCEKFREPFEQIGNWYVEIEWDVVYLREKPVGKRAHFRCRPDDEGPE